MIYVASLTDYNAGVLHGEWITVDGLDADDIHAAVATILKSSPTANGGRCWECDVPEDIHEQMLGALPELSLRHAFAGSGQVAEEWAIHDYEGFHGIEISEWDSFERVATLAAALNDASDPAALAAWIEHRGDVADGIETFEEAYLGERTALDYAYEYIEEAGYLTDVPETVATYFDYEAFARDLVMGGDVFESGPYLFNANV